MASLTDAGVLTVVDYDCQLRTAQLDPGSQVWKRGRWNGPSLAPGDAIYARGVVQDTTLHVESAWANIVSLSGPMARTTPRGLVVRTGPRTTHAVALSDATVENGAPVSSLRPGHFVHLVASTDPAGPTITATQVTPSMAGTPTHDELVPEIGPHGPDAINCPYLYTGLSTFFCCGGVNGCGYNSCPTGTSGGKCGTCRSDNRQMAWMVVGGNCTAPCDSCCISLPNLSCGKSVSLVNPCGSQSTVVTVADCGPHGRCYSPGFGCNGYKAVRFDLTPCAFSALGGSFNSGFVTTHATVSLPC